MNFKSAGEPFTIEALKFETGLSGKLGSHPEPLFLSLCLYDLKNKRTISETFHFDFNNTHNFGQLGVKVFLFFINHYHRMSTRWTQSFL
jgi:hypothetical protein